MPSGWYPRFSFDGAYLAAGNNGVTVYAITPSPFNLAAVASLNGQSPKWLTNSSILYQRIINGADRLWTAAAAGWTPTDLNHAGYGNFQAGGGFWLGSRNSPLQLELSTGGTIPLGSTPWVDANGRYSYLRGSNRQEVWLSDVGRISSGSNTNADLSVALSGAAWTKLPGYRTYGWRGTTIQDLTVRAGGELYPRVIDTPGGPWLLVQGNVGLYLHPWGNATTLTITAGAANYPHAIYHVPSGQFFVAWSVNGVLQTQALAINTLDPLYAVADGTVVGGGGSGGGGGTVSGGGDTQVVPSGKLADAAKLRGARKPRAVYPHLKQIKDPDAVAATRILYDRVFQVEQLIAGSGGVNAQIVAVQQSQAAQAAAVQTQIEQLSIASTGTSPALGGAFPTPTPVPPGGGGGEGPGPGGGIANQLAVVEAARVTYDAFSGVERAGRIVNQVAWDLKDQGVGVVRKTSGANWMGWSIDVIMVSPGGATYDILQDAEGTANPQWTRTSPTGFGDLDDWQAPVDPSSI